MAEKKDNSKIAIEPVNDNAEAANDKKTVKCTERTVQWSWKVDQ